MALTPDMVLQLAPDLQIDVTGGDLEVRSGQGTLRYHLRELEVLAAFVDPRTVADAVAVLELVSPTRAQQSDVRAMVRELVDGGVLIMPGEIAATPTTAVAWGFESAGVHIEMLNDATRTEAFLSAIHRNVREGDVVVDLGTGTGVLAVAAAQAGARKVYAIEHTGIADTAEAVFRDAGFADRITLLRGHSTAIEVPEPADVLVSELVGDEPLAERLLEVSADAVARFLKPGGRQLPSRIRIFARGVRLSDNVIDEQVFSEANVKAWQRRYRLNLSGLLATPQLIPYRFQTRARRAAKWEAVTEPVELADIDLSAPPTSIDAAIRTDALVSSRLDAAAIFFELDVDDERTISTDPTRAPRDNHWRTTVWLLPDRAPIERGDPLTFFYRYTAARVTLDVMRG